MIMNPGVYTYNLYTCSVPPLLISSEVRITWIGYANNIMSNQHAFDKQERNVTEDDSCSHTTGRGEANLVEPGKKYINDAQVNNVKEQEMFQVE